MENKEIKPGKLIVLEGADGSGKSSATKYLYDYLQSKGIDCIKTREIGGTPLAEKLRDLSFNVIGEKVDPIARLLMLYAARTQHIKTVIEPALAAGKHVISDRYIYSSYVYQGFLDNLGDIIVSLEINPLTEFLGKAPDCLFFFNIDAITSVNRNRQRQGGIDTIYKQDVDFADKVIRAYKASVNCYAHEKKETFFELNGEQPKEIINKQLENYINRFLEIENA